MGFGRCTGCQLPETILQNFIASIPNIISLLGSNTGSNVLRIINLEHRKKARGD